VEPVEYNYRGAAELREPARLVRENPTEVSGISSFLRDGADIYTTYPLSARRRGLSDGYYLST